jgi:hypothetical protein
MILNDAITNSKQLSAFLQQTGLFDVHEHHAPQSTFLHSQRRIDYIFASPELRSWIRHSGSLSFNEGYQTDHRTLFVDVAHNFFEFSPSPIATPSTRLLRSGNPEDTNHYLGKLRRLFEAHNIAARTHKLQTTHSRLSEAQFRRIINAIDRDITRAMLNAERSLRRPPQRFQFSPELRNCGLMKRYWSIRLHDLRNGTWSEQRYQSILRARCSHEPHFQPPEFLNRQLAEATIEQALSTVTKELRQLRTKEANLREHCLHSLLEQYLSDSNPDTQAESRRRAQIVQRTITAESIRHHFASVGQPIKPRQQGSITRLIIPRSRDVTQAHLLPEEVWDQCSPDDIRFEKVIDPLDIQQHLLEYNRRSFRKASTSPFGHGLIHDVLGFNGLTPQATQLLNGVFPAEWAGRSDVMTTFLQKLARPPSDIPPIDTNITTKVFKQGISAWRESTSTSPSGRHLGHYKALLQDDDLLLPIIELVQLSILHGIALDRWKKSVTVMIEKIASFPVITKLRVIHLFEADYNLVLKLLWGKRLMKHANKYNLINEQQFARKSCTALQPAMLRELVFDLCRQTKTDLSLGDLDATACFDRIIVCLAMIAARRWGMPASAVSTHAEALKFMKYFVKTAFGISEHNYEGTTFEPLFGTGQGSGGSPPAWISLSSILLDCLDHIIPDTMEFQSPDAKERFSRRALQYVDDTTLGRTSTDESYDEKVARLEAIIQVWEQLLHLSGGALNLKKCFYFVVHWYWKDGRPTMYIPLPTDPTVCLTCSTTHRKEMLQYCGTTDGPRTLGVRLSPDGSSDSQLKVLHAKVATFASALSRARYTYAQAATCHDSYYVPMMRYVLPTLAVDEECLEQVQRPVIGPFLNHLGYNRNMPRAVVFGPKHHGGIGLYDMRTEMGVETITMLQESLYRMDSVGEMIVISLKHSQLEGGIPSPLLEDTQTFLPYLTPTWVLSIRQFLYMHQIQIKVTSLLPLSLTASNDEFIMEAAVSQGGHTDSDLRDINLVRLHLQVITLADITNRCGKQISLDAWNGKSLTDRSSTYSWPRQPHVVPRQLRSWRRFLRTTFLTGTSTYLRRPLRDFTPSHLRWRFHYSPITEYLYDTTTGMCSPTSHIRRHRGQYGLWRTTLALPRDKHPATIDSQRHIFHFQISDPELPRQHSYPKDFQDYCSTLEPLEQQLLEPVQFHAPQSDIQQALTRRHHDLTLATDGGLKELRGSFGFRLLDNKRRLLVTGAGSISGGINELSSLRAELFGITSPMRWLYHYQIYTGVIAHGTIHWISDSKSAIANTEPLKRTPRYRIPDNADIIAYLQDSLRHTRVKLQGEWERSHQDSNSTFDDLPFSAQQNVLADGMATQALSFNVHLPTCHVPSLGCSLVIDGHIVVGHAKRQIRDHINTYLLREYIATSNGWSANTRSKVNWSCFGQHLRHLKGPSHRRRLQFIYRWNNTGLQKGRLVQDDELRTTAQRCPACHAATECHDHLFFCIVLKERRDELSSCLEFEKPNAVHVGLQTLSLCIKVWLNNSDPMQITLSQLPSHIRPYVQAALLSQQAIGWSNLFRGFLSKDWSTVFSLPHHPSRHNDSTRGTTLSLKVLYSLAEYTTQLWQHRNIILHQRDIDTCRTAANTLHQATINFLLTQRDKCLPGDRHLFHPPRLKNLQHATAGTQKQWIRAVRRSLQRASDHRSKGQTTITQFFRLSRTHAPT